MAEENPLIEIKSPPKKIEDTREQYLSENEKLIIGPSGFVFRAYPTLKERLQQYNKEQELYNEHIKLHKSNSTNNLHSKKKDKIFLQPILRFKNRTDFERICDTVQQYVLPSEQESLREIRERHVKSVDFPTGLLYKGGFKDMKKLEKLTRNNKKNNLNIIKSMFYLGNLTNMNNTTKNKTTKNIDINNLTNKELNLTGNKKPEIYFTRLQRLNAEAKKIRNDLHYKTHFKGVESIYINPKPMYDIIKKAENFYVNKKVENFAYNQKMEKVLVEKKNEYKEDIKDLINEQKEKEKIINTKVFSNFLNNKNYYNDRAKVNKYEKVKENQEEKIKKIKDMNYLKNLAFETHNEHQKYGNGDRLNTDSSEDRNRNRKKATFDNENQLRIGGKLYHMQNQMEQIAKQILNKCKFYSTKSKFLFFLY